MIFRFGVVVVGFGIFWGDHPLCPPPPQNAPEDHFQKILTNVSWSTHLWKKWSGTWAEFFCNNIV
jgi:hypothetical protein